MDVLFYYSCRNVTALLHGTRCVHAIDQRIKSLGRVALLVVVLQVVELQGYGVPLTLLATFRY